MAWTICALTPDRQALFRFDGGPWTQINQGGIEQLFGGGFGLFATIFAGDPASGIPNNSVYRWRISENGTLNAWHPVGGPGSEFAVTADAFYGLTPGHEAVWRWDGPGVGDGRQWTEIGGAAVDLFGGDFGLFATNPAHGDIFHFTGSGWTRVGNPGANFVVTAESVYGLAGTNVWRYNGTGDVWTQIGSPADHLYAGPWGLVATNPSDHQVYHYLGQPNQWQAIGGPGASFAVTDNTVFGLTPDKQAVFRYNGSPYQWSQVGGPADSLYAFKEQDV
jgi:hypothetical protein